MKDPIEFNSHTSSAASAPRDNGFSPWQRLKTKRISYLTIPLLVMATITEFVILATGWRYQQVVCLPKGMGVTFFGIGPIGATILAVELLKLPLAIWTASRRGWRKGLMLTVGLPLICLLTFQLVKDMAVYEMGVAMAPANEMLAKATDQEVKISQLKAELADIAHKKQDRETKLAEITAREAKAKADYDDSLKQNEDLRKDAINLTDYQRKQLTDVDARESAIIAQFNADGDQINKSLADLRARRETELGRDSKWNAEEARIDNAYKTKLSDYQNKKAEYQKAKSEYDSANVLKRQFMKEPVDPGVAPVRESNTVLKSSQVAELETQIKAKEAELASVNAKRRDRVAQVETEAQQLRSEFDKRSGTKREEADKNRQQAATAYAALAAELNSQQKEADSELSTAVQKVGGIQAELDSAQKVAEGLYEAREASIRNTQVHRIATTVEIIRGLFKGERPMSIKATAKERGDILTDQISMVRIWVYPVLAFIVAFLPTLMVEIGFSTIFEPEQQRSLHRFGFLGRVLHQVEVRAGRLKTLRAERLASEANAKLAAREKALASAQANSSQAVQDLEAEVLAARETAAACVAENEEKLRQMEEQFTEQAKRREEEWVAKVSSMADSLNRTVLEKDALKDLQKAEIERQVQFRQKAWSDRVTQLSQDLDSQRAASEEERTAMMQEYQKKLQAVTEDCKAQVMLARRQLADAEFAAGEKSAKLSVDLKDALHTRDIAESQLKLQAEAQNLKLAQAREETGREVEKALRQEKLKFDRQQAEFDKLSRQREDAYERQLKQKEQEMKLEFDARVAEERNRIEQESRGRDAEHEQLFEARLRDIESHWKQDAVKLEENAQTRLKQREQQLQSQAEARQREIQAQAEAEYRRRESEYERQLEAQTRNAETKLRDELQQKESQIGSRLKQRELELIKKSEAQIAELKEKSAKELAAKEEEWARQAEARVHAVEARLTGEVQQHEELTQSKLRQRDQQWQAKLEVTRAELQAQNEEALRRRGAEADALMRELEKRLREEMRQKDEVAQARIKQFEKDLATQLQEQAEARLMAAHAQWESQTEIRVRSAVEPIKTQLVRTEKERDEARHANMEGSRRVQDLEKKLIDASNFLGSWRNGKGMPAQTS